MTNFEITYNLFQNLNKFEQKEIIKQFLDKQFDENVNESLQKIDSNLEKTFEQVSTYDINFDEYFCTNFFECIEENEVILTKTNYEINFLKKIAKSSPQYDAKNESSSFKINDSDSSCWEFYSEQYDWGDFEYYVDNSKYKIIEFDDFCKRLKFETISPYYGTFE